MKFAAYVALVASASAKDVAMDIIQLEQIVDGLLRGATNAEGFNDIAKCVTDLEAGLGDAETAVKDFKAGGATNVMNGLKACGDLIKTVQAGMKDCSSTQADWDRLKAMAEVISSPKDFVYHVGKDLLINGREIYGEVTTAVTDYDKQDWEGFGFNVGKAAAKTILGQEPELKGTCRTSHHDENSCNADSACSWCKSAAVASSCNEIADAKTLPPSIFSCAKVSEEPVKDVDCRGTYHDQNSCDANAACSWCRSAAVASACNTLADARTLPSAIFACDKVQEEVKAFDCRGTYHDQNSCDANDACTWCKSAAVASACNTVEDAAKLPAAIFACDAKASKFLY
jgi:hypothetical protein